MIQSIHPEAELEFEAADFYNERDEGLGNDFSEEVFATIDRIIKFPASWPRSSHRTRRCLCNRFPYSVIYRHTENELTIYAVAHQKRKPGLLEYANKIEPTAAWDMFFYNITKACEVKYSNFVRIERNGNGSV